VNELEMLKKRLAGLLVKRPSVTVGLWGSPGIGKTFAAQSLLHETACKNISLHATTSPSGIALGLPRPKKLAAWVERTLEKMGSGEFVETAAITDACGSILIGLAPFVVHLEDVYEAPPEQLEFIQNLARVVQRIKGVGLIVTSRTEPPEPFNAVQLQALSLEDTKQMLEREAGAPLPSECVEWIQTRVVGNPLYALEFFRFLARQGFLWNDGRHWHWREPPGDTMPLTVEALIEQSLVQVLEVPAFAAVLAAGSMIPNSLMQGSTRLWAAMSEMKPGVLHETIEHLERNGLLQNATFTHPLFPEVIQRGLSASQRQQLAQRAIRHLEADTPQEAVLFLEPAGLESDAALALLERAWTRADALGDELRAARLIVRAARIAPQARAVNLALDAAKRLGDLEMHTALEMLDWVLKLEPNNAQGMLLRARTLVMTATFAQAEEAFEQLPLEVRSSEAGQETWFDMICRADKKRLVQYWDEHPEARTRFDLIASRIFAHIDQIETEQAIALGQTALDNPELTDDWLRAKILNALGGVYRSSYQFEKADEIFTQTIELLETKLGGRQMYILLNNRAMARRAIARFREARSDLETCIALASEVRETSSMALAFGTLADLEMDAGRYERAEDLLHQARELLEPLELHRFHVDLEDSSSDLYRIWPGHAYAGMMALKHGRTALHMARTLESSAAVLNALIRAGKAEAQFGQIESAHAIANELDEMYNPEMGIPYHEVSWIRALICERQGQPEQALEQYRLARTACVQIREEAVKYVLDLEVARLSQDTELAHTTLTWFETRGMHHYSNRIKQFFPRLCTQDTGQHAISAAARSPTVRLEFLGPIRFSIQDKPEPVRGRKRQELLALLLEARIAGRAEVHKLELLDALYPDSIEDQATSALKETVRTTRASLSADVIQTTQNGYALGAVTSDAEDFLRTGDVRLWRGAYLDGLTLESRDEAVRESLHLALSSAAMNALETDPREAARVGRILLDFDGYNLDSLELCLKALRASNNHKSLTRLYAEAQDRLLEVGEIIPERWQDFLERSSVEA
jgi:tetratricopeptide (TPR) repeat protein